MPASHTAGNNNKYINYLFWDSLFLLSMNLVNSWIEAPVDANILEILLVDGHRGWPSLVQRLLRLNVVGSKPLHRANPEHDIPCSIANRSIARQTSSCVIKFSPFSLLQDIFYANPIKTATSRFS